MTETIYDVAAKEIEIPIEKVHPDPVQPRVHPDAELAESIKTQGVLQAIRVEPITPSSSLPDLVCEHCDRPFVEIASFGDEFLLQDGERRFRGAIAAKQTTILAKVVPPASESERLIRQLTSNTGKPLTPLEEAFAFQRVMDAEKISQNELAKRLGRPRSVIGDRVRLAELDASWAELISNGTLQVSHAAIISIFADVPAEYQKKAAANLVADYRAKQFIDNGDAIPVERFKDLIFVAFRDYVKPMKDVPGYKGPTFSFKRNVYSGPEKFAAAITQWRPIFRARENKRAKERRQSGSTSGKRQTEQRDRHKEAIDALVEAAGVPSREGSFYVAEKKDEVRLYGPDGFNEYSTWDPSVVLANVVPSKLCRVNVKSGGTYLVTNDRAAIDAGRAAYFEKLAGHFAEKAKVLRAKIEPALKSGKYKVTGPGCRQLIGDNRDAFLYHAIAGVPMRFKGEHSNALTLDVSQLTDDEAGRVLSVDAAIAGEKIRLPHPWDIIDAAGKQIRASAELKLPAQIPAAERRAESKAAGHERGKQIAIARKNGAKAPDRECAVVEVATA
jgi:ParB/RepB/Spo0J family partition protein